MGSAKDIVLRPISSKEANALVKRVHYSGKVVNNSQIHIGVFYQGKLEGAMQFGPSLDKRKIQGLVSGTLWNEFIELNRMAFSDDLPRNSESRALAIAFKLLRKHAPQLKWVISFADATQCGDGTIYRASGFVLTGIKKNDQIWVMPSGEITTRLVATDTRRPERQRLLNTFHSLAARNGHAPRQMSKVLSRVTLTKGKNVLETGGASMKPFIDAGAVPLEGFQLRYIYFLDPAYRQRLTVPILPFSRIDELGAGMYRGEKREHANEATQDAPGVQPGEGSANLTRSLK